MRKIKEVKILTKGYLYELERAVNEALKEGWEFHGSVMSAVCGGYSIILVKYEEVLK